MVHHHTWCLVPSSLNVNQLQEFVYWNIFLLSVLKCQVGGQSSEGCPLIHPVHVRIRIPFALLMTDLDQLVNVLIGAADVLLERRLDDVVPTH